MQKSGNLLLKTMALAILCGQAIAMDIEQCTHFWKNDHGEFLASDKIYGKDVGPSPFQNGEGIYRCTLSLEDTHAGQFLYIGEIGDAANATIGKMTYEHGLSLTGKATYMRYVPFMLEVATFYQEAGTYHLEIAYKDIVKYQSGIRSGKISLESKLGRWIRFIYDSPRFTFHLFQFVVLVIFAIGFLLLPGLALKARMGYLFATVFSSLSVLAMTSIPRSFIAPDISIKFNDMIQILALGLISQALNSFLTMGTTNRKNGRITFTALESTIAALLLLPLDINWPYYLILYGVLVMWVGVVPLAVQSYKLLSNKSMLNFTFSPAILKGAIYFLGTMVTCWDAINLIFFKASMPFITQYTLYMASSACIFYFVLEKNSQIEKFRRHFDSFQNNLIETFLSKKDDKILLFNRMSQFMAQTFQTERVSIVEIKDDIVSILGGEGDFTNIYSKTNLQDAPFLMRALERDADANGTFFENGHYRQSCVAKLQSLEHQKIFICLAGFRFGYMTPLHQELLAMVSQHLSQLANIILLQKQSDDTNKLLLMMRNHVAPIQLKSEEYFLKHFHIKNAGKGHCFILGDLVQSTHLNSCYGSRVIKEACNDFLNQFWQNCKHLGLIIAVSKGDTVGIMVPQVMSDSSTGHAVKRGFEMFKMLSLQMEKLNELARAKGIAHTLQYRFTMGMLETSLSDEKDTASLLCLDDIDDSEIDILSRVLDKVNAPGEFTVLESVYRGLENTDDLILLREERLRGRTNNVRIYLLKNFDIEKKVG